MGQANKDGTPGKQIVLGLARSDTETFFESGTTEINSISPYHAIGGSRFSLPISAPSTPKEKSVAFKLVWHGRVRASC